MRRIILRDDLGGADNHVTDNDVGVDLDRRLEGDGFDRRCDDFDFGFHNLGSDGVEDGELQGGSGIAVHPQIAGGAERSGNRELLSARDN